VDDRRVLCSQPMDDLSGTVPWELVKQQMQIAAAPTRSW